MEKAGWKSGLALLALVAAAALPGRAEASAPPRPSIDGIVGASLAAAGQTLLPGVSDELYLRRVHLDLLGAAPTPAEREAFLADPAPDKRARLVESLFLRPEFAEYLALKWGDILRVKSEYPSNLWPNAVQAYHGWILEAMRTNMPYDRFARELVTASGSNFREPQVNFLRASPGRDPATLARAASLAFLGRPLDSFDPGIAADFGRFFSRVAFKRSMEWKEEIVYTDPLAALLPGDGAPVSYRFPDGSRREAPAGLDPRLLFADWLASPDNPWFARVMANRVWAWLMGRGVKEPLDAGPGTATEACPGLLDHLAREFTASGWDLRALYRLVLASRTYAQDSRGPAEPAFARYAIRRLDAEVLADALARVTGGGEAYVSPIPEPFTYVPRENRAIALADGSVASAFLVTFGRPARDTGLASERSHGVTVDQKLHLLNSTALRLGIERGPVVGETLVRAKTDPKEALSFLYLSILGREPEPAEARIAAAHLRKKAANPRQGFTDIAWALVNGAEFLFRH